MILGTSFSWHGIAGCHARFKVPLSEHQFWSRKKERKSGKTGSRKSEDRSPKSEVGGPEVGRPKLEDRSRKTEVGRPEGDLIVVFLLSDFSDFRTEFARHALRTAKAKAARGRIKLQQPK